MTDTKSQPKPLSNDDIVLQRNLPLVQKLAKFGVVAGSYSKPPASKDTFMISKGPGVPGTIMLWAGGERVDIKVTGDKDKRQAVLTVTEQARIVDVPVKREWNTSRPQAEPTTVQNQLLNQALSTQVPNETSRKVINVKTEIIDRAQTEAYVPEHSRYKAVATGTVRIRAKASEQTFLVGHDEVTQFICALPKPVSTVKQAHEALRPAGVPKNAKRQGEWFFVPATKAEIEAGRTVKGNVVHRGGRQNRWGWTSTGYSRRRLESNSSHTSLAEQTLLIPSNSKVSPSAVLVRGVIKDLRTHHHADLDLGDVWHKAVRNTEITETVAQTANSALAARPTRRWD